MKSRTKLSALLLAAIIFAAGCTPTGELLPEIMEGEIDQPPQGIEVTPGQKTEITLAYSPEDFINPYKCTSENNLSLMPLVYEGLFTITEEFSAENALCESYNNANGIWNFSIKQGVKFHNGQELTAKDVVFSIKTAQNSAKYAQKSANISQVLQSGKYSISISLHTADSLLPLLLDMPIIPDNSAQIPSPAGTGRYTMHAEDGITELLANESYRTGAAPIKKISLSAIYEDSEIAYVVGSSILDAVYFEKPFEASAPIRGSFDTFTYPTRDFHYLGINKTTGQLSNPFLRKAISVAVERKQITQKAFSGYADAAELPISPSISAFGSKLETLNEILKQGEFRDANGDGILEDSAGMPLKFTIIVPEESLVKKQAANVAAQTLTAAGISVTSLPLPREEFLRRVTNGNFELYYGETILNEQFDISAIVAEGGAANFGGASTATQTYIAALKSSDVSATATAREQLYNIFEQDMPIIPLAFGRGCVVSAKNMMNPVIGAAENPYYNLHEWANPS